MQTRYEKLQCHLAHIEELKPSSFIWEVILKASSIFSRYWAFLIPKTELNDVKTIHVFTVDGDEEENIPRYMTFDFRDFLTTLRSLGVTVKFDDELHTDNSFVFPDCYIVTKGDIWQYCTWNPGNEIPSEIPSQVTLLVLPALYSTIENQLTMKVIPDFKDLSSSAGFESAMKMLGME